MSKNLLQIVSEDLIFLSKKINEKDISDQDLRRLSDVLRRFLIHGDLYKVARLVGINLKIYDIDETRFESTDPLFHQTGGGKHQGMKVRSVSIYNRAFSAEEIKQHYEKSRQKVKKLVPLSKHMAQSCIKMDGTTFSRNEIIKYICNKRGGSHFDERRDESEEKLALLDKHSDQTKIAGKDAVFFEFLSIVQKLVNNSGMQKLLRRIQKELDGMNPPLN